ncbi:MAG TPA: dihydroorotate dehydrogenase-like protein [Casimicrobiaceae bacterium]|nr:dihydroorotate dehydrogenase-like protein [Casimicrobiaceae bacterium]
MTTDLSATYLGLPLRNPIIASASPLTSTVEGIRAIEDAGAGAVVMPSLYEEQICAEDTAYAMYTDHGSYSQYEAGSYFPRLHDYDSGVSGHLDTLRRAVAAVDIPVVASLNAVTQEGWTDYAVKLERAGAAALELNLHFIPADLTLSGQDVEARYVDAVRAVKGAVKVPVAVKLSPYFSSFGHMAQRLVAAGADGLVLFNRFYQPDFDLATLSPKSTLKLSTSHETGPSLLWICMLNGRIDASLAATSGVETAEEVIKYLLVGADAVMTTSALLRNGPGYIRDLLAGLGAWLGENGHASVSDIRGRKSLEQEDNVSELLRAQYMHLLTGYVPTRLVA